MRYYFSNILSHCKHNLWDILWGKFVIGQLFFFKLSFTAARAAQFFKYISDSSLEKEILLTLLYKSWSSVLWFLWDKMWKKLQGNTYFQTKTSTSGIANTSSRAWNWGERPYWTIVSNRTRTIPRESFRALRYWSCSSTLAEVALQTWGYTKHINSINLITSSWLKSRDMRISKYLCAKLR